MFGREEEEEKEEGGKEGRQEEGMLLLLLSAISTNVELSVLTITVIISLLCSSAAQHPTCM